MIVDIEGLPIEEAETGLTELARLGSQVMVLGTVNDVNYFRRIMRTGARDYLMKPIDADMLGEIFVRLEQPGDGVTPKGRVVGIIGARGGVGVTTIAINTAFIMAEKLSRRTALVDMDIYAGNIALALDIEPTRGLREALDDPERVDETFLQNAMAKFGKSLHVLATEEAFDDTVRLTDDKVLMLADTIRANFDMAIMDLPRHFIMREPALFSRFDDIVIVSELTLQSLRDANRLMKLMSVRNRQAKVHVIANQVGTKPDVTIKEFEAGHGGAAALRLPARSQGHGEDDAEGPAADHRRRQAQDRHRPAPVLHRARRRAGGGQGPRRLLPAPGKKVTRHGRRTRGPPERRQRPAVGAALGRLRPAAPEARARGPAEGEPAAARRARQRRAGDPGRRRPGRARASPSSASCCATSSRRCASSAPPPPRPAPVEAPPAADPLYDPLAESAAKNAPEAKNKRELQVKQQVMPLLMQRIDISVASALGPEELRNQIAEIVEEIIVDLKIQLNATELQVDRPAARRRHGRPRAARAAALGRDRDRHHGQRPAPGLRRAQGQGSS